MCKNTAAGEHNESEINMWGLIKIFWALYKSGRGILNPNYNPMRHAPAEVKFLATVILACFWCLAFGIFAGELLTIGYNMVGHVAIVSMAFGTWAVFRQFKRTYGVRAGTADFLRMPDRSSRCDEMTEEERVARVKEWNNRDIWNDPAVATEQTTDKQKLYYGS